MATPDSLLLLRQAAKSDTAPIPTTSADPSAEPEQAPGAPLSQATHLRFVHGGGSIVIPLDVPTRFVSANEPVNLRSIFFAWINRDLTLPDYNASAARLSEEPGANAVQTLPFVERVDLYTWLEGATDESDYIKPGAGDTTAGFGVAGIAGADLGAAAAKNAAASAGVGMGRSGRGTLDPRLAAVYNGERRTGDRNSVLRGIKPTDFSHVRKLAVQFVPKKNPQNGTGSTAATGAGVGAPGLSKTALSLNQKPARRPDPIILLSPSASSLLRMSNARSFLEGGKFMPADNAASMPNLLHLSRQLREIDPVRPMRFVLVEGTDQFKPEYWNRVVAVFTTGQAWQFKGYKWSTPTELFRRIPGVYIGWRGDQPPETIRSWGQRVLPVAVDRWHEAGSGAEATRFRDKEVVEQVWRMIELNMLSRGWRDSGPAPV